MKKIIALLSVIAFMLSSCNNNNKIDDVKAYLEAHNNHNVEEALAFFNESGRFVMGSQPDLIGKPAIRKLEEWNKAIESTLQASDFDQNGDTVVIGEIIEYNKWFEAFGIDSVVYVPGTKFVFKNDLIYILEPTSLNESSATRVASQFKPFMEWASANKNADLQNLMPNRYFDYDANKAETWINLLAEWKEMQMKADTTGTSQ